MSTKEVIALVDTAITDIEDDALQIVSTATEQALGIAEVAVTVNEIKAISLKLAEGNGKLADVFVDLDKTAGRLRDVSF